MPARGSRPRGLKVADEPTKDDEMIMDAQAAAKVQTTLATPGWREVIRPALDNRRTYYLGSLLSRQERMEDVIFAQQSVLAIDEIFSFIDHTLAEGKNAEEYFSNKGKE